MLLCVAFNVGMRDVSACLRLCGKRNLGRWWCDFSLVLFYYAVGDHSLEEFRLASESVSVGAVLGILR